MNKKFYIKSICASAGNVYHYLTGNIENWENVSYSYVWNKPFHLDKVDMDNVIVDKILSSVNFMNHVNQYGIKFDQQ